MAHEWVQSHPWLGRRVPNVQWLPELLGTTPVFLPRPPDSAQNPPTLDPLAATIPSWHRSFLGMVPW